MPSSARLVLALAASVLVAACQFVPAQLRGSELIVMEVKNGGPRPVELAVASMGNVGEVMGRAEPGVVPPRQTMSVNFFVPTSGQWAIWANGNELMGALDLRGKRGPVPMGIEVDANGGMGWWCKADCP